MPKRWRISVFCRALTFISKKFRFFASENAEFYFPFVVRSLRDEHTTNRLEAERKHHSSCLSCATKAQRMSGRIFLFPLLSLASLLSLSYVFLGNSMFSLAFCTCPPLPIKEKEVWWTSKITYKHILLQISHKCIFFNLYFFLYVFVSSQSFVTKNHVHSREIEMKYVKLWSLSLKQTHDLQGAP